VPGAHQRRDEVAADRARGAGDEDVQLRRSGGGVDDAQKLRNVRHVLVPAGRKGTICGSFCNADGKSRHLRVVALQAPDAGWLDGAVPSVRGVREEVCEGMAKVRAAAKKVSCDDCYFRCNLLCALDLDEPCATFRPDHPDGLRPPRQLRFHFRQERRTHAAWAFPTAEEQAALRR
jgi:hypothetical protein